MGKACDTMKGAAQGVTYWFFPERIKPPECVMKLLEGVYPDVDWNRVRFHYDLPWFVKLVWLVPPFGSQLPVAITLPDFYVPWRANVFFGWNQLGYCSEFDLATFVHEGYHVQQIQDIFAGVGIGFVNPFIIGYLATAFGRENGSSPYEARAYAVAGDGSASIFESCYDTNLPICDCLTPPATSDEPALNQANLDLFFSKCLAIVQHSTPGTFWTFLDDTVKYMPWVKWLTDTAARLSERAVTGFLGAILLGVAFIAWVASMGVAIALAAAMEVLHIAFQAVGAIVSGVMWVAAGIVCFFDWLAGLILGRFAEAWQTVVTVFGDAVRGFLDAVAGVHRWAGDLREDCQEWTESRECAEWEDQGYQECARREDQGYRDCCDWIPCKWFCKAWVWVSHLVCVAWTWVENLVCVAWTWTVSTGCRMLTGAVMGATGWAVRE